MAIDVKLMTVEELAAMPDNGMRHELVRGELIETMPVNEEHGEIAATIAALLRGPIKLAGRGRVGVETGVIISRHPPTVLGPDVSITLVGSDEPRAQGFLERMPEVVFEVVSPSDSAAEVPDKSWLYLDAGVQMVVAVWPRRAVVTIMTADGVTRTFGMSDDLDLAPVVEGVTLLVAEIFE